MNAYIFLSKFLIACLIFIIAAGCSTKSLPDSGNAQSISQKSPESTRSSSASDNGTFMTFKDDTDRTVTLKTQPKRIIVLSPQLLDLLYAVDGSAIAKTTSPNGAVPEKAKGIEDVGGISTVNTEKLLSLKPDLVIGSTSFHRELSNILDSSNIPFALFSLSTYKELKEKAPLFGKLAGKESKAEDELIKLDEKINLLTAKLPDKKPTFIMLNVTPTSVSVQRTNTVGLEVANMLKMKNVAEKLDASSKSQSTAPYSLEKVVELDPDYIFILIHGAREDGERKIKSDLSAQPAWAALRAVKENHLTVLPSDLLLSNPGFRLNESVNYLAEYVYPEIFKNGK